MNWFPFTVTTVAFLYEATASGRLDSSGNRFMLSFLEPYISGGTIILYITANNITRVTVTSPGLLETYTLDFQAHETWILELSTDVRYSNWFKVMKQGISVTSSPAKVTVLAQDKADYGGSGYMALPLRVLSNHYILVTKHNALSTGPAFLLIGVKNNTKVDVHFKLKDSGNCDSHYTGDVVPYFLNEHDVLGFECDRDFTGTFIESSHPIAVISGHRFLALDTAIEAKDPVQEMLLPVELFGFSYVLFDNSAWERSTINVIVAAYDDTTVYYGEGDTLFLNAYEYTELDTTLGQQCLTSDKPIQVVSFSRGNPGGETDGDTAMTILLPTTTFSNKVGVNMGVLSGVMLSEVGRFHMMMIVDRRTVPEGSVGVDVVHEQLPWCYFDTYTSSGPWPDWDKPRDWRFGVYMYGTYGGGWSGFAHPLFADFDGLGCHVGCEHGNCTWGWNNFYYDYYCICDDLYFGESCNISMLAESHVQWLGGEVTVQQTLNEVNFPTPVLDSTTIETSFHTSITKNSETIVSVASDTSPNHSHIQSANPGSNSPSGSTSVFSTIRPMLSTSYNSDTLQQSQKSSSMDAPSMSVSTPKSSTSSASDYLPLGYPSITSQLSVNMDDLFYSASDSTTTQIVTSIEPKPSMSISENGIIDSQYSGLPTISTTVDIMGSIQIVTESEMTSLITASATFLIMTTPSDRTSPMSSSSWSKLSSLYGADSMTSQTTASATILFVTASSSTLSSLSSVSSLSATLASMSSSSSSISMSSTLSSLYETNSMMTQEPCSMSTPPPEDKPDCYWFCASYSDEDTDIKELTLKIKKMLTLERRNLSSAIRRRRSAMDSRPSATGIGYVGILTLTFIAAAIFLTDLSGLLNGFKRQKNRYDSILKSF